MQHETGTARRLNARGYELFNEYFERKGHKRHDAPKEILWDDAYSEAVPGVIGLPENPSNKYEFTKAIVESLGDQYEALKFDHGFWAWLTLKHVDVLVRQDEKGWDVLAAQNYIMPSRATLYLKSEAARLYRHRLWGPCYVYHQYGELSRALLAASLDVLGDGYDAVLFHKAMSVPILQAIDLLYFDTETNAGSGMERGPTRVSGQLRRGSIRDFTDMVRQMGYVYSLHRMSPIDMINMLPVAEFRPFIVNARKRIARGDLAPGMLAEKMAA